MLCNSYVMCLTTWGNYHSNGRWLRYTARGLKYLPDHETAVTKLDISL